MTVHRTPEQERRIEAIIDCGAYSSIDDVVEAALIAVQERAAPSFDGPEEELEALLLQGIKSAELTEEEFWSSVDKAVDAMLAERNAASS